jgi:hypothetical protein
MIFGTENSIQLARFRAVALAEDTLLCKAKQQRSRWSSANAEANVADCFRTEALLQFSQDVDLGNLFEFAMQRRSRQTYLQRAVFPTRSC